MEFRQLRTFRLVAEHLNFTKAAEHLFMAQSSVSAQIRTLEDELNVKLFDRIGRRVLLTDAGEKLLGYARRIEEMDEEIRYEISGEDDVRGSLTIRVPETLSMVYLPLILARFHRENPKVHLDFINCTDRRLREELNSGRIDLAFLMTDAVHFQNVNVHMVRTEALILASGPSHPFAGQDQVSFADLEGRLILLPKTD